jgi:hypothetical protein
MRGTWYPVGLSNEVAFFNMLANSQNFIFQKLNGFFPSQDDSLALTYHYKALRRAGEMMKEPQTHNSEAIIGAVISFMIHHVSGFDDVNMLHHSCFLGAAWELLGR